MRKKTIILVKQILNLLRFKLQTIVEVTHTLSHSHGNIY